MSIKNPYGVIGWSLLLCSVLYYVDFSLSIPYAVGAVIKILLLGLIPFWLLPKTVSKSFFTRIKQPPSKSLLLLGLGTIVFVVACAIVFSPFVDYESIGEELSKQKITALNFIAVGIYIILVNSLLEEYFFRGFVFFSLFKTSKLLAYTFSSLLFAIYHIIIFKTWFAPWVMGLVLFGLFVGGVLFCYLNTQSKTLYKSWVVHIGADIGIIIAGLLFVF